MAVLVPIPVLPEWCIISKSFNITYEEAKTYLGFKNVPNDVYVYLEFIFADRTAKREFFDWWEDKLEYGALPFYGKIPLFAEEDYYLLAQVGILKEKEDPANIITGKFILFNNITRSKAAAPITHNVEVTIPEGSQNVMIPLDSEDPQGLPLTYFIQEGSSYIGDLAIIAGASMIYDSKRGYEGVDTIWYYSYNGVYKSALRKITINLTKRETFGFKVQPGPDLFQTSLGRYVQVREIV